MARVYQPQGTGPFPTVLDLHGGAWNNKDRFANEPMDRAVAASGVLVVAIDMTLAPEAPYPASIQDANYGVRWLKWKAPTWNGDPSTHRHHRQLDRRPRRRAARHAAARSALQRDPPGRGAERSTRRVAYVAMRSPISDPCARYQHAEKRQREHMIKNTQELLRAVGDDPRGQPAGDPRAPRAGEPACRCSSCRARSTTTCCPRSRRSSRPPTAPPAAIAARSLRRLRP